jgi:cytoskeletal protein CcmA (bactofilin family)
MLTSKEQKRAADEISNSSNVIGKGTCWKEILKPMATFVLKEKYIGSVKSKSKIALGHSCYIEGNIIAQNADIEGEVKGKLEISELLVLKATAKIHGDILTGKLVVEPGAVFNGSCKMGAVIKDIKIGDSNGMHALRPEGAIAN